MGLTTLAWVAVTLLTAPSDMETLTHFVRKIQPGGPGWAKVREQMQAEELTAKGWSIPTGILCMLVGAFAIYSALFSTGYCIYGKTRAGLLLAAFCLLSFLFLWRLSKKIMD